MKLFYANNPIDANKKLVERLNLVFPDLKGLNFDGEFYRVRSNDLNHAFGSGLFVDGVYEKPETFKRSSSYDFFKSNNDDFWITGMDFWDYIQDTPVFLVDLTKDQGANFINRVIDAYDKQAKIYQGKLPKGVPDSIVIFDPVIDLIIDPRNYMEGIIERGQERVGKNLNVYTFVGERNS